MLACLSALSSLAPRDVTPPFISTPPHPACCATIVIPARDEEERIAATLAALADQRLINGAPLDPRSYDVILLANNCTDGTAATARRIALANPALTLHIVELSLPSHLASAGHARRLALDEACRRLLDNGRPDGVIASLDADTRPAPTWLAAILDAIGGGAEAVGGRVLTDPVERALLPPGARLRHLRDVGHRLLLAEIETLLDPVAHDPWPRHYQHFGASFAVTAAAYRRAGGVPPVPALEDVALYLALRHSGARVRHSPAVRAVTSARPAARSAVGFAQQFAVWSALHEAGTLQLVESAARVEARLRARHRARLLWRQLRDGGRALPGAVAEIAAGLGVPAACLGARLDPALPFGALDAHLERHQLISEAQGRWSQEITAAIRDLRRLRDRLRGASVPPLTPLEEVEPVGVGPLAAEVTQGIAGTIEEFLMHSVAGQGIVGRRLGPVDQQQMAAWGQSGDDLVAG